MDSPWCNVNSTVFNSTLTFPLVEVPAGRGPCQLYGEAAVLRDGVEQPEVGDPAGRSEVPGGRHAFK